MGVSHRFGHHYLLRIAYCVLRIPYSVFRIPYCVLRIAGTDVRRNCFLLVIPETSSLTPKYKWVAEMASHVRRHRLRKMRISLKACSNDFSRVLGP